MRSLYINKIIFATLLSSILIGSCESKKNEMKFVIHSLHPYKQLLREDFNNNGDTTSIMTLFYVIETDTSDTAIIVKKIDMFISDSINPNLSKFKKFDKFVIEFFKSRKGFDKDWFEVQNDFIDYHGDDLIAVYEWENGIFWYRHFYKNGELLLGGEDLKLEDVK